GEHLRGRPGRRSGPGTIPRKLCTRILRGQSMRHPTAATFGLTTALLLLFAAPGAAQDHQHHATGEVLGTVSFPITCSEAAAGEFERAVAMLHSFWFAEANAAFQQVASVDPTCAMAYWGQAMTAMGNPMARSLPSAANLARGLDASQRAVELAASQSEREQLYAAAVHAYFAGADRDHAARMTAHEEAMAAVAGEFPDDDEAVIFHARAMVANAPPTDLTFARQLAGAERM